MNHEWLKNHTQEEFFLLLFGLKDTPFNDKVGFRMKEDDSKVYKKLDSKQKEYIQEIRLPNYCQSEILKINSDKIQFARMQAIANQGLKK